MTLFHALMFNVKSSVHWSKLFTFKNKETVTPQDILGIIIIYQAINQTRIP